jgi:hypothetical protein
MNNESIIKDLLHIRSSSDIVLNFIIYVFAGLFSFTQLLVVNNQDAFIALCVCVGFDWVCGLLKAVIKNNFEAKKSIKIIFIPIVLVIHS